MPFPVTPPTSRKRTRRASGGAFLSKNDFRVLELVTPCPAIARQTVKEALLSNTTFSSLIEPSGFAIVVTPNRLLVWNALRPEQAPIALAFDNHDVDSESARRVALNYTGSDEKALRSVIYTQKSGLFLNVGVDGKQQRAHLPLLRNEHATACVLVHPQFCVVSTSSHRLLRIRIGEERLDFEPVQIDRSGASLFGRGGAPPPASFAYRKLLCLGPMQLYAITEHAIEELIGSESGSWSLSWSSTSVLDDALGVVPESSKALIVDVAVAHNRMAILTSAPAGPLDQLQFCIALYEHRPGEPDLVPVYRAQLLDSLEAEPGESLRVELSDQDIALAFVYGRRMLSILDLASGVHDCIRFDEPMLLGGGKAHDHRGCFFVSAANGIICARLSRGPTTNLLEYADERDSVVDAGLSGAFNAFQQARISNCKILVDALSGADISDDALKISNEILDSENLALQERQSKHALFTEFLNVMPTSATSLWHRLSDTTQKAIRLHGDSIEMALSFEQVLASPSSSFHEVLPSARGELDSVREAMLPAQERMKLFGKVSQFTKAFRKIIVSLEKFDPSRRLLLTAVLCRAVRIIFNFAAEHIHSDSWLFEPETRDFLQSLLQQLRVGLVDESSVSEFVQKGFAYANYYYVSCVLLSGYVAQFSALESALGRVTLRSALDAEYSDIRSRLGRDLIELAPDTESNLRQRYALAFEFGERFTDFLVLAELCELCQWPERSDAYAREFGNAYALACCSIWHNKRQYERLLAHVGQPWLAEFVEDKPRLSWIVDMDKGDLSSAFAKLLELSKDESIELSLRAFYGSVAKLSLLQTTQCTPERLAELSTHLSMIQSEISQCSKVDSS